MSIGNADGLCRICLNESFSYAHIYQVKLYDDILFFETINDVCQLDVDVDDGLPEFVCCSCYVKVTEFVKFKMRAHDGRAVLQSMKERMINAQSELFKNYQSNFYLKNAEDEQECGPSVKVEIKVEEESAESECEPENFEFHNENDVKLREEGFFRNNGIQEYTGFQNEMFSTPVKMEYEESEECNTVNSDSPSVGSFPGTGERDCGLSENALGSSRSSIYSERRINDLVSYSKISPSQTKLHSMAPKSGKKSRKGIEVKTKLEIIRKHDQGSKTNELAREYGLAHSTVSTILQNKAKFKDLKVSDASKRVIKGRELIVEMERLLMLWIKERQMLGESVGASFVCDKAKCIYGDLKCKTPKSSNEVYEDFKASKGWFERFKIRTGMHNINRHWEPGRSDKKNAAKFN